MPVISQSLMAARAQQMQGQSQVQAIERELCSTDGQNASAVSMPMSMLAHEGHSDAPDDGSMNACGYCNFLANHAAVPAVPSLVLALVALLVFVMARAWPPLRHIVFGAFPSGRPRAPPFFPYSAA